MARAHNAHDMRIGNGRESFFLLFTDFFFFFFLTFFYVKFPLGQSERGKHKIIFIVNYKERRRRTESDISIFLWHFVSIIRLKVISPIFRAGFFIFCVAFVIHMDMLYAPMTFYRCVVRCKVNDLNYFNLL